MFCGGMRRYIAPPGVYQHNRIRNNKCQMAMTGHGKEDSSQQKGLSVKALHEPPGMSRYIGKGICEVCVTPLPVDYCI